jgi:hypothetical protein
VCVQSTAMAIGVSDGNARDNQHNNPGKFATEQTKCRKHELAYSHTGYWFVVFIRSCFLALEPSAIRYQSVLEILELRQHERLRTQQGLDPSDDSERVQYRVNCFRSSSARIADAIAKAIVMRLAGTPSLTVLVPVPCKHLAHKTT